mgnify:CR=1 FL=1
MIDVFNTKFSKEIDILNASGEIQLTLIPHFQIIIVYDYGYIFLIDEHKTRWAYAKNSWTIKIPGFYCENLPIGEHTIFNEHFVRVPDAETIMEKIEEYLSPYILNHIWIKDVYDINLN